MLTRIHTLPTLGFCVLLTALPTLAANEVVYRDVTAIQVPGFVPLQVRAYENDGEGYFTDVTRLVIPTETVGRSWGMAVGAPRPGCY